MFGELGYLNLVSNIIKNGVKEVGRNGTTYTKGWSNVKIFTKK